MGPTEIGLLILVGVGILALFAYIAQHIEDTRRERQLRLMQLRFDIRRASHLLSSFPDLFMTTEIKKLLLHYLQTKWETIVELENNDENRAQLDRIKERFKEKVEPIPHPEGSLTAFPDAGSANQAQGVLREFMKFLADIEKKGDISKKIHTNFESRIKRAYNRASYDMEIFECLAIEQMSGGEAALPKLRNCFYNMENLNRDHSLDRQLYEVRTYVDRLTEEKKAAEAEREAKRKAEREEEARYDQMTF